MISNSILKLLSVSNGSNRSVTLSLAASWALACLTGVDHVISSLTENKSSKSDLVPFISLICSIVFF